MTNDCRPNLFLSHAWEDKDAFVRPLAEALSLEFDVWYDEYALKPGDSLLEKISEGLRSCDRGIVVLSRHFFEKRWTQAELNGLFAHTTKSFRLAPSQIAETIVENAFLRFTEIFTQRLNRRMI
jgi:TIR domain